MYQSTASGCKTEITLLKTIQSKQLELFLLTDCVVFNAVFKQYFSLIMAASVPIHAFLKSAQ